MHRRADKRGLIFLLLVLLSFLTIIPSAKAGGPPPVHSWGFSFGQNFVSVAEYDYSAQQGNYFTRLRVCYVIGTKKGNHGRDFPIRFEGFWLMAGLPPLLLPLALVIWRHIVRRKRAATF